MQFDGSKPSDKLKEPPKLHMRLLPYYQCFVDLRPGNDTPQGPCNIPWREIVEWGEYHFLTYEQIERLKYMVRKLDSVFIKHAAKKQ